MNIILLFDAENAFNSLKTEFALKNFHSNDFYGILQNPIAPQIGTQMTEALQVSFRVFVNYSTTGM